jgi:choline dehydrogenase-like flavoprotein
MNSSSSAFTIQRSLSDVDQEFDVIIIGGGITGISVAREAASRGLKTILLERGDFGSVPVPQRQSTFMAEFVTLSNMTLRSYEKVCVNVASWHLVHRTLLSRLVSSCQRGVGANLRRRSLVPEFCYTTLWLLIEICARQTVCGFLIRAG